MNLLRRHLFSSTLMLQFCSSLSFRHPSSLTLKCKLNSNYHFATHRRVSLGGEPSGPFQDINSSKKSEAAKGVSTLAPAVILVRTFLDQNVGAAARAMLNFGLSDLRLVDPQCDFLSADARARAAGAAAVVLEQATVYPTVEAATADLRSTFATTARLRDMTVAVCTPAEVARRVVAIAAEAPEAAAGPGGDKGGGDQLEGADAGSVGAYRCGLIFGPERSGLTNSDLEGVDALVQIATNPNFASLNLAQAVNICGFQYYQMMTMAATGGARAELEAGSGAPAASSSGSVSSDAAGSEAVLRVRDDEAMATKGEVANLLRRLESALEAADSRRGSTPENKHHMVAAQNQKLRLLAGRAQLTEREVSLLHGVLSALTKTQPPKT